MENNNTLFKAIITANNKEIFAHKVASKVADIVADIIRFSLNPSMPSSD